jgi:hypothetical protein
MRARSPLTQRITTDKRIDCAGQRNHCLCKIAQLGHPFRRIGYDKARRLVGFRTAGKPHEVRLRLFDRPRACDENIHQSPVVRGVRAVARDSTSSFNFAKSQ